MLDSRSEANLIGVCPLLVDKVRAAAAILAGQSTFLLVVSGLRTAAQQNALYAQGRTAPGHIVTNAKAGLSMHNYGVAVDVVPYLRGDGGELNWNASTPQYRAMVTALKAQGLEYGGDWKHFPDADHFQLTAPGVGANPSMEMTAAYTDGNPAQLAGIWKSVFGVNA